MRRILAIDGGGIKGVFAAGFLARIEDLLGVRAAEHFDLIAGTSAGGMIALSLGLGHDAAAAVRRYEEAAPRVFYRSGWFGRIRRVLTSKYSALPLRRELIDHFGEARVGDSRNRLLIPTLDVAANRVHIYKTSHHPSLFHDITARAVEVVLAAVAAPTYFPLHRTHDGAAMVDGSIWAHNPSLLAVIEAITLLNWRCDEISVLSIGTPPEELAWGKGRSPHIGAYEASFNLANLFTNAQQVSATVNCRQLLGADSVVRIEPSSRLRNVPLDGVDSIPYLKYLGIMEAERHVETLRDRFFHGPAEAFTPCNGFDGPDKLPPPREIAATGNEKGAA